MSVKTKPPTIEEYHKEAYRIAVNFCPEIKPCRECRWPVANGYCCTTCGSESP